MNQCVALISINILSGLWIFFFCKLRFKLNEEEKKMGTVKIVWISFADKIINLWFFGFNCAISFIFVGKMTFMTRWPTYFILFFEFKKKIVYLHGRKSLTEVWRLKWHIFNDVDVYFLIWFIRWFISIQSNVELHICSMWTK